MVDFTLFTLTYQTCLVYCLTRRRIFGPIISKCLVLPDDVSTLFGIESTLNYDVPQARLLYLPLQSAVCSHPPSTFIYSAFFTASGLPSSLSAPLAVLTMSCGPQGGWDGLNVKLGGEEGRPRLTQVTLELEALTACIHERLLHLFSFVTGRFSPSTVFLMCSLPIFKFNHEDGVNN